MKKGMKRYILFISYCIDGRQVNREREIYRFSDAEAKAELNRIHDTEKTAHEGFVTRERGNDRVGEFCKYV